MKRPVIRVIRPADPEYQNQLDLEFLNRRDPGGQRPEDLFFEALAKAYNKAPIGSFLSLSSRYESLGRLRQGLKRRGLISREDYSSCKVTRGTDGKLLPKELQGFTIRKLSKKLLPLIQE